MKDICKNCGQWHGLHEWDTMRCPANGHEDGQFRQTTYTEDDSDELATLTARVEEQAARIAELEAGLALASQRIGYLSEGFAPDVDPETLVAKWQADIKEYLQVQS